MLFDQFKMAKNKKIEQEEVIELDQSSMDEPEEEVQAMVQAAAASKKKRKPRKKKESKDVEEEPADEAAMEVDEQGAESQDAADLPDQEIDEEVDIDTNIGYSFTETREPPPELLMPLLKYQKQFLAWALKQEQGNVKGGILADEMVRAPS